MKSVALKFTIVYIGVGVVWILFSDKIAAALTPDISELVWFQTLKGVSYVLLTGLLLYLLIARYQKRIAQTLREKESTNSDLRLLLYKVNHDLRSPVTSIQGLVGLLQKSNDPAASAAYIEKINVCTATLLSLLKHLLEVGQILENEFPLTETKLQDIRKELEPHLQVYINERAVNLEWDLQEAPVKTNLHAVRLVLQHLAENAIRYRNEKKAMADIRISAKEENGFLVLRVSDNGIGISKLALPHIFELFYRGSNIGGGSGIGLFIVKTIVDRMKGTISVESAEYKGSTFTVKFPRQA